MIIVRDIDNYKPYTYFTEYKSLPAALAFVKALLQRGYKWAVLPRNGVYDIMVQRPGIGDAWVEDTLIGFIQRDNPDKRDIDAKTLAKAARANAQSKRWEALGI